MFRSECLVRLWEGVGVLWHSMSGEILLTDTSSGLRMAKIACLQILLPGPLCGSSTVLSSHAASQPLLVHAPPQLGMLGYWLTGKMVVLHKGLRRSASCRERSQGVV